MPPFKCAKGCKTKRGVAAWHTAKSQCPYEQQANPAPVKTGPSSTTEGEVAATGPSVQTKGFDGSLPSSPADGSATATSPSPSGKPGALTFKDRVANTVASLNKGKETKAVAIEDLTWVVPKESVTRFFGVVFRFSEQVANMFNKFMGMDPVPTDIFRVNAADQVLLGEMMQAPITKLTKTLGFKTVESAVRWIDSLTGLSIFGLMFGNLVLFYASNLPKSTRYIKWKEKKNANAEKRKQEKLEAERKAYLADTERRRLNGDVSGVPTGPNVGKGPGPTLAGA